MKCTHPTDSPLQISSEVIAVKLVAVLYREGLINHTVYRQVTAQYSALVKPVKQLNDSLPSFFNFLYTARKGGNANADNTTTAIFRVYEFRPQP